MSTIVNIIQDPEPVTVNIDNQENIEVNVSVPVPEAPVDGLQYARQDASWVEVVAVGLTAVSFGAFIHGLAIKPTPADVDELVIKDSEDSNNAKGLSWANLKATVVESNSITNAKLAQVAENIIKGRVSSGVGNVEDLTVAQVRTLLAVAYQSMTDAFQFGGQAHSGNKTETFAASKTFDADNGTNQYMLVSGDCTINISNLNIGVMIIKLKNSGAGHTITIGSSFGDPMDDIAELKTADGDTNTIMVIRGADDTYEYTINGRTV